MFYFNVLLYEINVFLHKNYTVLPDKDFFFLPDQDFEQSKNISAGKTW